MDATIFPVSVPPVRSTFWIAGWFETRLPAVGPKPVITLTTPSGMPACWHSLASSIVVVGVNSEGLMITVLPAASAGASFFVRISSG